MELVNILDNFGNVIKVVSREVAHKRNLLHPIVHIWIYNSKKEILIQKRAFNKDVFPNFWDVSCTGHVKANESVIMAVYRELEEELGIKVKEKELEFLGSIKDSSSWEDIYENNFAHIFLLKYDKPIKKLQKEELSEIKWVSFNTLKKMLTDLDKHKFAKKEEGYFEFIIARIESKFKRD